MTLEKNLSYLSHYVFCSVTSTVWIVVRASLAFDTSLTIILLQVILCLHLCECLIHLGASILGHGLVLLGGFIVGGTNDPHHLLHLSLA